MREISINLKEILAIVNMAKQDKCYHHWLYTGLAATTGYVTDAEIDEFCSMLVGEESRVESFYQAEHDASLQRLTNWRDEYCNKAY
jgi:hypothetical protein